MRWRRGVQFAVAVCSVLVLVGTGTGWVTLRHLTTGSAALGGALAGALAGGSASPDGSVNVLLIGLDTRQDQNGNPLPAPILDQLHAGDGSQGGYNTNTLIVMHIPADGSKVTAFSIPRDDLVPIPGYRPDKIKQAYGVTKDATEQQLRTHGVTDQATLEQQGREAGREATIGVVTTLTGLPIDHFAEITLAGFYDLATALGGVQVCLNHPVADTYSGANFPAGPQTLSGAQALAFVRQRHGLTNGDLDRTHRQQAFLSSAVHQITSAGTLTDPSRLSGLTDAAHRDIVLDNGWDVLAFATSAQNLTGGNAAFYTLPIEGFVHANDEDDNLIDPAHIRRFITDTITAAAQPPAPPPAPGPPPGPNPAAAGVVVEVRNASGAPGEAAATQAALTAQGFSPGDTGNTTTATASSVAYPAGEQAAAAAAAAVLGAGIGLRADNAVPAGHLLVVLGTTYTPPPGAAGPPAPSGPAGPPVLAGGVPCVD